MDGPGDSISEIELLSRNFLSQDSNLDEYDDVDTTVLSPRRVPIGRSVENDIVNVVTEEDDDDQTNSSGFSASIPKTVQDIDGVLNEIRLRSSPDPNDFIFRSGNRQYYNGKYYDDDAMTETSFQTNTNLYQELNKAHESFMESFGTTIKTGLGLSRSSKNDNADGDNGGESDHESDGYHKNSTFDLSWLRSRMSAANTESDRRRNRYENNHFDTYENNYVYSPDKNQSQVYAHNWERNSQDLNLESYGNNPVEVRHNSDPRDYWNEMSYSEEDLEDALSRSNQGSRKSPSQKKQTSKSYIGSKLTAYWFRTRNGRRYQRQRQDGQREGLFRGTSSSPSRKLMRIHWVATGCSMLAIVFVVVGAILMGTATYGSESTRPQNATLVIDSPSWMGSNNTIDRSTNSSQIPPSTIIVDGSSISTTDSPTPLPVTPATPNPTSVTTGAPTLRPTKEPTSAPTVKATSSSHGPLPISGAKQTSMNYVSSNRKPPESSIESQVGKIPVSGGKSENNKSNSDSDTVTSASQQFASLPITSGDENNHSQQEQPEEGDDEEETIGYESTNNKEVTTISVTHKPTPAPTKYQKKAKHSKRRRLYDDLKGQKQRKLSVDENE